jgi:hypothetical protein
VRSCPRKQFAHGHRVPAAATRRRDALRLSALKFGGAKERFKMIAKKDSKLPKIR